MKTTQLEKLLFTQGGKCFFCKDKLEHSEASVEHLVATANGGCNDINDNCVACCKAVNALLGSLPLKHKIEIILNQEGAFKCPSASKAKKIHPKPAPKPVNKLSPKETEWLNQIIADLQKRGNACPKKTKTLASIIAAMPKLKGIQETEISHLIKQLESAGKITITDEKVSYTL